MTMKNYNPIIVNRVLPHRSEGEVQQFVFGTVTIPLSGGAKNHVTIKTAELDCIGNSNNISAAPDGYYKLRKKVSGAWYNRFKKRYGAEFVPEFIVPYRSAMLIGHNAGYFFDLQGCVSFYKTTSTIGIDEIRINSYKDKVLSDRLDRLEECGLKLQDGSGHFVKPSIINKLVTLGGSRDATEEFYKVIGQYFAENDRPAVKFNTQYTSKL